MVWLFQIVFWVKLLLNQPNTTSTFKKFKYFELKQILKKLFISLRCKSGSIERNIVKVSQRISSLFLPNECTHLYTIKFEFILFII